MAARDLGSRPPIAAEVGRDRLTSVGREPTPRTASGGQNASGGGHLIGVPRRRTARSLVDHYPRTKSEDDAVGAPRLVLRRWDTTVVPRRVPPAPMRSKCPKGRGRVPRPTSQLEVLVGRAGDESVRQWASLRRSRPRGAASRAPVLRKAPLGRRRTLASSGSCRQDWIVPSRLIRPGARALSGESGEVEKSHTEVLTKPSLALCTS